MSNAIIKQQGDSPVVADNIWDIQLGAGSFILGALTGALVTAAVGRLTAKGDALPKPPTPRGWPINFAHRGGAKVVPEDTIEGFREGFAMGGGVVECDVHASAEGTIVVIHDAVVDRTTDGAGPVAEKTVPELQSLDAGYRFSRRWWCDVSVARQGRQDPHTGSLVPGVSGRTVQYRDQGSSFRHRGDRFPPDRSRWGAGTHLGGFR